MTTNVKIGIGITLAVGTILAIVTKDKWMPLFKKTDVAPTGKPVNKGAEKSEFAGRTGRHHGGGGRHHGGRRNYPPFPYGYGYGYPYYDPTLMCEFKDKSGKKIIANCNENIAITLQNRF